MLEYINAVVDASTVEEVWAIHVDKMAEYGFDRLIYGYTRLRTKSSIGGREDLLVLSNHDPDYVDAYINGGLYLEAPMVRWASKNIGACSWRWIAENHDNLSEAERKILEYNQKMDVTAGYTISFRDSRTQHKGAIALTAPKGTSQDEVDALWARHGAEIETMNKVAHLRIGGLPYSGEICALTERQREALEWIGSGKTTQDTAQIMGLTPATVEKHLRLARQTLNVETTAHAVLKASIQNQIFVVRP